MACGTPLYSVETVIDNSADGVGLFRIEQLCFARELPPSEEDLFSDSSARVSSDDPQLDIGGATGNRLPCAQYFPSA